MSMTNDEQFGTSCVPGNGYITVEDFKGMLRELDPDIPESEIQGMVNEIDQDDSGTVDFDGELASEGTFSNRINHGALISSFNSSYTTS